MEKGIRVARDEKELETVYRMTQQAETAFGNGGLYLEKFIENFRHIEIQIIGDTYGNVIHLVNVIVQFKEECKSSLKKHPPVLSEDKRQKNG